jgi:hypothetical protein
MKHTRKHKKSHKKRKTRHHHHHHHKSKKGGNLFSKPSLDQLIETHKKKCLTKKEKCNNLYCSFQQDNEKYKCLDLESKIKQEINQVLLTKQKELERINEEIKKQKCDGIITKNCNEIDDCGWLTCGNQQKCTYDQTFCHNLIQTKNQIQTDINKIMKEMNQERRVDQKILEKGNDYLDDMDMIRFNKDQTGILIDNEEIIVYDQDYLKYLKLLESKKKPIKDLKKEVLYNNKKYEDKFRNMEKHKQTI